MEPFQSALWLEIKSLFNLKMIIFIWQKIAKLVVGFLNQLLMNFWSISFRFQKKITLTAHRAIMLIQVLIWVVSVIILKSPIPYSIDLYFQSTLADYRSLLSGSAQLNTISLVCWNFNAAFPLKKYWFHSAPCSHQPSLKSYRTSISQNPPTPSPADSRNR